MTDPTIRDLPEALARIQDLESERNELLDRLDRIGKLVESLDKKLDAAIEAKTQGHS